MNRFLTSAQVTAVHMGRIDHGQDLLAELDTLCQAHNLHKAWLNALGAVQRARLAAYDQEQRAYRYFDIDRPLEITHLGGNVSLKEGRPFLHAHVTLADMQGRTYGGHLAPGTIVFACEYIFFALDGASLERKPDQRTGLALWPFGLEGA